MTLWATHHKYLESFEMWCWRRMEKISWTEHVRNEEELLRVNEQTNILHEIRKRIVHNLRRNCLLKQVIKGKINGETEVTRRHRKLLDDLTDKRGYSHLKEEALDRTLWKAHFGRGFGPVIRQTTE
jgi:sugar-specific transcriptional regulator TrmB